MENTAKDFHHPYQPNPIQRQFMNAVYQCLEDGQVGIFESPTGTPQLSGSQNIIVDLAQGP